MIQGSSSDYRRNLVEDLPTVHAFPTGFTHTDVGLQRWSQLISASLERTIETALTEDELDPTQVETKIRNLVQDLILPFLKDCEGEPFAGGAFLGSDGHFYSLPSLYAHTYCMSSPERDYSPDCPHDHTPWTIANREHAGFARIIRFVEKHSMRLTSSSQGYSLLRLLNLSSSLSSQSEEMTHLSPLDLHATISGDLLFFYKEAEKLLPSPVKDRCTEWAEQFLHRLGTLRDAEKKLIMAERDEWTLLKEQLNLLQDVIPHLSTTPIDTWISKYQKWIKPIEIYERFLALADCPEPLETTHFLERSVRILRQGERKEINALFSPTSSWIGSLHSHLSRLNALAEQAFRTYEDDLSLALCDWCRTTLKEFPSDTEEEKSWNFLRQKLPFLERLCIDPDTFLPLEEDALLSNDEGKRTYNLDSLQLRQTLYPELSAVAHPALPLFLTWMKESRDLLTLQQIAQVSKRRLNKTERQNHIRSEYQTRLDLAKQKLRTQQEDLLRPLHQQPSLDELEQQNDPLTQRLTAFEVQLQTLGQKVALLQKSMQQHGKDQETLKIDLAHIQTYAGEIHCEAQTLAREIDATLERAQGKGSSVNHTLSELHGKIERLTEYHEVLKKDVETCERSAKSRNKGFLQGIIALTGFLAGTVIAFATGNPVAGAGVASGLIGLGTSTTHKGS